jgi:preprotein translocase subunit SecY
MPIIFALSILLFPSMISGYFGTYQGLIGAVATNIGLFFANPWVRDSFYFALVILFTYFYTMVTFDPKTVSDNLQRMGGFIPGVRPGQSTAIFMKHILNRVLLTGAVFLGLIAVLPSIIAGATSITQFSFLVGGTSLLIVVSVVLDTIRQINAQLQMREYDTF